MEKNNICDIFMRLSGINMAQAIKYNDLFEMALKRVEEMSIFNSSAICCKSDKQKLEYLAGVIAFEMYAAEKSDNDFSSFKTLDIAINASPKDAMQRLSKLKDNAMINAKELLKDQSFMFRRVN